MTPDELLEHVQGLPAKPGPYTVKLASLAKDGRSQKQHWIGWLSEYDGPGFYGRSNGKRDARYIYGHIQCPPMLLWLAEAAGVAGELVTAAAAAVKPGDRVTTQCAALRRIIPWAVVERRLTR